MIRNWSVGFGVGQYLTRAGYTNGPVYNSHFNVGMAQLAGATGMTAIMPVNQANKAAAIAAGAYFYVDIFSSTIYEGKLTNVNFRYSNNWNGNFNWALDINTSEEYMYDGEFVELATGTKTAANSGATITIPVNVDIYPEWYNRIRIVVWGADTSARYIGVGAQCSLSGTFDDAQLISPYPVTVPTYRTVENRPGIDYDPNKTTSVFAEDQLQRSDNIRAVQNVVGIGANQLNYDVKRNINSTNILTLDDWFVSAAANTGSISDVETPTIYTTPDAYYLKGNFTGLFSSSGAWICYWYTDIIDILPVALPFRFVSDATGDWYDGTIQFEPRYRRFTLYLTTGIQGDIWYGEFDLMFPRQIELWQQSWTQFIKGSRPIS